MGFDPTTVERTEGTRVVVGLRGEWDLHSRAALADALSRVIASSRGDVVIDLSETDFIDTAIVRAFADGQQFLHSLGRRLTFRSPSRVATRLLALFSLTDLIERPEGGDP
jgi:anti-anti-sigma factor